MKSGAKTIAKLTKAVEEAKQEQEAEKAALEKKTEEWKEIENQAFVVHDEYNGAKEVKSWSHSGLGCMGHVAPRHVTSSDVSVAFAGAGPHPCHSLCDRCRVLRSPRGSEAGQQRRGTPPHPRFPQDGRVTWRPGTGYRF